MEYPLAFVRHIMYSPNATLYDIVSQIKPFFFLSIRSKKFIFKSLDNQNALFKRVALKTENMCCLFLPHFTCQNKLFFFQFVYSDRSKVKVMFKNKHDPNYVRIYEQT